MEVWNEFKQPLPFEIGKQYNMIYLGETQHTTKNNKLVNVLLFKDNTLTTYWTPVFTIRGADITIDRLKDYVNTGVKITCMDKGYMLEFGKVITGIAF